MPLQKIQGTSCSYFCMIVLSPSARNSMERPEDISISFRIWWEYTPGRCHPSFVLSLCLLGWHLCSQEVGTLTISGTFSRSSTTYPSALKRPDPGGVPVPSLHRLPQNPERRGLREQGGGELIRGAFLALPSAGVGSETVTNQWKKGTGWKKTSSRAFLFCNAVFV